MASFGKKVRKTIKKVGRIHAKIGAKIVKVATPVVSAVVTAYAGPVAGAGVAVGLSRAARYAGATAARARGVKGLAARKKGRSLAKQTLKYGLLGTGVGALGGAIVSGSVMGALTGAGSQLFQTLGLAKKPVELNREARDFGAQTTENEHLLNEDVVTGPTHVPTTPGWLPNQTGNQEPSFLERLRDRAIETVAGRLGQTDKTPPKDDKTGHDGPDDAVAEILEALKGRNTNQRPEDDAVPESGGLLAFWEELPPLGKIALGGGAAYLAYKTLGKKAG